MRCLTIETFDDSAATCSLFLLLVTVNAECVSRRLVIRHSSGTTGVRLRELWI